MQKKLEGNQGILEFVKPDVKGNLYLLQLAYFTSSNRIFPEIHVSALKHANYAHIYLPVTKCTTN